MANYVRQRNKLTTNDMEIALTHNKNSPVNFVSNDVVVTKCAYLFGHETDLVAVNKNGYCTEVEIKISKGDFKKDFTKDHYHESGYIKNFYYAVPYYMVDFALENLPEGAGLLEVIPHKNCGIVRIKKYAIPRKGARKISEDKLEKLKRYNGMRYWSLLRSIRKKLWNDYVETYNIEQKELKNGIRKSSRRNKENI